MEMSLDLSLGYVPKTISEYLKEASKVNDVSQRLSKLDDYLNKLKDEMRKIDAFKRELPLCMLLLKDAVLRLEEEVMQCKPLMVDESLRLNENGKLEVRGEDDLADKKSWLSSVQLWSRNEDSEFDCKRESKSEAQQRSEEDDDRSTCENPIVHLCNNMNKGAELVPYSNKGVIRRFQGRGVRIEEKEVEVVSQVTGLSLMTPPPITELGSQNSPNIAARSASNNLTKMPKPPQNLQQQLQNNKKPRRCWSPELHRRFVDALEKLGGSHVATPKQIREHMQVDGLTNDEVKSHLQKYRLHIRKLPASASSGLNSKTSISHSDSPQGPVQVSTSAMCNSNTELDAMEPEDEHNNSESHSCNGGPGFDVQQ